MQVVVDAVATAENQDATSLSPIYNVVASDALNRLLADNQGDVEVSFTYHGYQVAASSAEVVLKPVE
ncbi:hypothetical protein D8S78_20865 [Natrialba swarupiae]|nr:hypothetical protein [Natrialba swarupiae]